MPDFATDGAGPARPKSSAEKLLSLLTDIRPGEGLGALLLTANVFLLLFAYYLLKTVREALILVESGAYVKAYSSAGQAVLLLAFIPLYGYVATKIVRIRLVTGLFLFFISNLVVFYGFGVAGWREGVAFYIWVGIFNYLSISQIWALANDLYTEEQGKRLFPMIGIGASLGAWLGAQSAERLVSVLGLTPYQIQLLAAALLLICCGITVAANLATSRVAAPERAHDGERTLAPGNGFGLVFASRYITLIALLIVLLNVVNSTGEFLLGSVVAARSKEAFPSDPAAQKQFVGAFYGTFFANVNLLGFLLQTFVASRVFRALGVRGSLYILPTIAIASYSLLAMLPVFGLIRLAKTLENATDYSIQNTIRHALFLPTSREEKYKAKAAVDTFFTRVGDVVQAGIVKLGAELHFALSGFAWINVGLTVVWIFVVSRLARQHRKMGF